jgi:hypothetical protein
MEMPAKKTGNMETETSEERRPMGWLQLMGEFQHTVKSSFGRPMTGDFWEHMRAARKEQLLAVRSLIDARLIRIEAEEEAAKERVVTKIEVK